jgi:hypothetical protein
MQLYKKANQLEDLGGDGKIYKHIKIIKYEGVDWIC